jgi:hypothetical protein
MSRVTRTAEYHLETVLDEQLVDALGGEMLTEEATPANPKNGA